jgi:hypothetical protein
MQDAKFKMQITSVILKRPMVWLTLIAAFVVFCVVQDRIAASGARRYVALQKEALAGRGPAVTIDEVMRPAVDRSVRLALVSSGAVAALGIGADLFIRRASRARHPGAHSVS